MPPAVFDSQQSPQRLSRPPEAKPLFGSHRGRHAARPWTRSLELGQRRGLHPVDPPPSLHDQLSTRPLPWSLSSFAHVQRPHPLIGTDRQPRPPSSRPGPRPSPHLQWRNPRPHLSTWTSGTLSFHGGPIAEWIPIISDHARPLPNFHQDGTHRHDPA